METAQDFSLLYLEFRDQLYHHLRRLTQDATLAEDLTQETFLHALERFTTFRGEGEISNWLYRIATNLFYDHLRKHKGKTALLQRSDDDEAEQELGIANITDPAPSLPALLEQKATTQCVNDCIDVLPTPYRQTLQLYSLEEKTTAESAAVLGCSTDAVKVRLHRARRMFKALATERCEVAADQNGVHCACQGRGQAPVPEVRSVQATAPSVL